MKGSKNLSYFNANPIFWVYHIFINKSHNYESWSYIYKNVPYNEVIAIQSLPMV